MKLNLEMNPKRIGLLEYSLREAKYELSAHCDKVYGVLLCRQATQVAIIRIERLIRDWRQLVDALEESKDGEQRC